MTIMPETVADNLGPDEAVRIIRAQTGPWYVTVMGTDGMVVKVVKADLIDSIRFEARHSLTVSYRISRLDDGRNFIDMELTC